ncbi:MAG: ubiquinone biosynthesis regulatory protein kinase UbiB, partial [Limnohabitans sp.]
APQYAKLLPQLPRLLTDYLRQSHQGDHRLIERLLREQQRTNGLLQVLVYMGLGFIASLFLLQVWSHFHMYFF